MVAWWCDGWVRVCSETTAVSTGVVAPFERGRCVCALKMIEAMARAAVRAARILRPRRTHHVRCGNVRSLHISRTCSRSCRDNFSDKDKVTGDGICMKAVAAQNAQLNLRSEVSPEMRRWAYECCREYLAGTWKHISEDDFIISVVTGGLSNLLYTCILRSDVPSMGGEPRQVLLRMYGAILQDPRSLVLESVMFATLAERKLGPALYGVFPEGRLEEFIPSKRLSCVDLRDPDLSALIACKMAQFHSMKVPLNKEPKWLYESIERYLKQVMQLDFSESSKRMKYDDLLACDLPNELQRLRDILNATPSPVVFCHNDCQEGNILLLDESSEKSKKLMIIDFEYCSYNYRGFDIGNHFCEWIYDYACDTWPYFHSDAKRYPTLDQQTHFLRNYIMENQGREHNISAAQSDKHVAQMLFEVNRFALASHFYWGLWAILQAKMSSISFGYLEYAQDRFKMYFAQKRNMEG
ncbi:choline/ethanolamine kinase-like [Lethenteron reissneri]|uniref:choline/ethanolamine kinase-like n=1 Tax=Lethenteron reissneri TaxID=7753 RepID=UPI002AB70C89|nr:choline/ethanolamine kinase-like [Lethenteron reissneri]